MAFNLPPPWDPGYALPSNVRKEGLQRRAFVTQWLPRGTYDNPAVGDGGYAVPEYVRAEGYGQGARVTKWLPRGTGLGDAEPPALFTTFGAQAARAILSRVASVPTAQRKATLKKILDKIDRTLWKRTDELAQTLVKRGLPAAQALEQALARSMSTGIASEIVQTGLRRTPPQPGTLLGLGCYGQQALGATAMAPASAIATVVKNLLPTTGAKTTPTPGQCSKDGMVWDAGGFWRRKKSGEQCVGPTYNVSAQSSGPQGGVTTGTGPGAIGVLVFEDGQSPFGFGGTLKEGARVEYTISSFPWSATGTKSAVDFLRRAWTWEPNTTHGSDTPANIAEWLNKLGLPKGSRISSDAIRGRREVYSWTASSGNKWVLYAALVDSNGKTEGYAPTAPLKVRYAIWNHGKGFWGDAKDVVSGIVDTVGDLACKVLNSPMAPQAGAAASAAAGAPPQAGTAGVAIAQNACGGGNAGAPQVVVAPASSSVLPVAIAAGGVLLAAALLTRKKK